MYFNSTVLARRYWEVVGIRRMQLEDFYSFLATVVRGLAHGAVRSDRRRGLNGQLERHTKFSRQRESEKEDGRMFRRICFFIRNRTFTTTSINHNSNTSIQYSIRVVKVTVIMVESNQRNKGY